MNNKRYPLASSTWGTEEIEAVESVLASGNFTMGQKVTEFESAFADYVGTKHAVMVNSGSSANLVLLAALKYVKGSNLKEGDEVIVPAVSWSTTFYPIQQLGFKLRFVDVNGSTLNIDVDQVARAITSKTKIVFAVNLLGNPCEFRKLKEICDSHQLILIEDNCESLGAKYHDRFTGSIGKAGTHSFFFSHHICTMEGGMVSTDDKSLAETMQSLRAHGWIRGLEKENSVYNLSENDWDNQWKFVLPGYNLRPLEIEAASGLAQLKKLPSFISERRLNAQKFFELFSKKPYLEIQEETGESSWFGFSIILKGSLKDRRTELTAFFESRGIESRAVVTGNFLKNPVIKYLPHSVFGEMKNAEHIDKNGLFFGNHHYSLTQELEYLSQTIEEFVNMRDRVGM